MVEQSTGTVYYSLNRHKLLERQLKRHLGHLNTVPEPLQAFIAVVDAAYQQADEDRARLERSMELSSQELLQANMELRKLVQTMEHQVAERTAELTRANAELATALQTLQQTQEQMVQQEKMSALGQLVAGIAHEINTPLGVVQASISNITHAMEQSLEQLPLLFQTLAAEHLEQFRTLLGWAIQPSPPRSSREERQLRKSLKQSFADQGLSRADQFAEIFSRMGVQPDLDAILPLLTEKDAPLVLETAYQLALIQNNSQNIRLAVDRAARIVYALKSYARQDITGIPVMASIPESIDTVLTLYQNQLRRGIEVTRLYHPVPPIPCYPEELAQVWSNLIGNAIHAMNDRGEIAIAIDSQDQFIQVDITDSGSGIPPELLSRIFEPFFTTKPMGEGSGLGLSIVRKIIDKHHGRIEVDSYPGCTRFQVWLPLRQS